ncbi:unnamed protein product [Tuber aestivum]|uniref:Uncharacterized protein n=1 Tax=Tuber aestivum TaxID=59557 RepID=A0A292PU17_9PEZI|nr:unnamed protein product [Tuber aestivum]
MSYVTCSTSPGTYEQAQLESRIPDTGIAGGASCRSDRQKQFFHTIPALYLGPIWDKILVLVQILGPCDFGELQLFLNAKNLKLGTSSSNSDSMITDFLASWNSCCDMDLIAKDQLELVHDKSVSSSALLDVSGAGSGCETNYYMFFWRQCCLRGLEAAFQDLFPGDRHRRSYYTQSLARDLINMTIEPGQRYTARVQGLAYSQFYSCSKEIFDYGKVNLLNVRYSKS